MNQTTRTESEPSTRPAAQAPTVDVLNLLRRQAALFSKLESVAAMQRGLITADDSRPLLALLAKRQTLTIELTSLAGQLRPVRSQWDTHRQMLTPDEQQEATDLWKDAERRLSGLISSDEQDARLLRAKKETAARGVGATITGRAALSAYAVPAGSGRRLDRMHEES